MKKLTLFIMLISYSGLSILAQTNSDLHNKYWVYKDRFNQIFTQAGVFNGEGQVSDGIRRNSCGSAFSQLQNGVEVTVTQNNSYPLTLGFGDAALDQGYYLMVLASEYWILKQEAADSSDRMKALKNQIYFAINAIERLDLNAEEYFNPNVQGSVNGFFLRTDADDEFLKSFNDNANSAGQIWENSPIRRVAGGNHHGPELSYIDSSGGGPKVYDRDSFRVNEGTDCGMKYREGNGSQNSQGDHANAMSQDQLYGILLGFKAILNWVDADLIVDPDGSGTRYDSMHIHNKVKDLTHKMMLHASKTRNTPFPINDRDEKEITTAVANICAEFNKNPYIGTDTIFLDTPRIEVIIAPILGDTIRIDTILFETKDTVAPAWFPGSTLRTCNSDSLANALFKSREVFKEANYVITNPADNDELVHRGAVATPMAYALELLGESMTGHDYPSPTAKWTNAVQAARWCLNAKWVVGSLTGIDVCGIPDVIPVAGTADNTQTLQLTAAVIKFIAMAQPELILDLMGDTTGQRIVDIVNAFPIGCLLTIPSPDAISTCVVGRPLNVQNKDFWRDLWNAYGNNQFLRVAQKGSLPINLIHNLAIASGTWDHATFNTWATFNNKPFSEILYANMNNLAPINTKTHYENALFAAQCEGTWHAGHFTAPTGDSTGAPYPSHLPWFTDNIFANRDSEFDGNRWERSLPGLDFMLMYNMYRMAELKHWQNGTGTPKSVNTQCPCKTYPDFRYVKNSTSILEQSATRTITVDGKEYQSTNAVIPIDNVIETTVNVQPVHTSYSDFNIRIPNYLLHDANVKGKETVNITPSGITYDTVFGEISVKQDLTICNSTLKLESHGKLIAEENSNPSFPSKIIVTDGSILEVLDEGIIELNNNTELIIEKGGILRINNGARIILNGSNAKLHINGELDLRPNAVFQPEPGSLGFGKVIFENNGGELRVSCNGNNKIIIDAQRSDARTNGNTYAATLKSIGNYHLESRGAYGMHTGWATEGLDSFAIRNSIVLINDGSQITSEAKFTSLNNVFVGGELYLRSRGLFLLGTRSYINNSSIRYLENGIEYMPLNLKNPLVVNNSSIRDCNKGIYSKGGLVDIRESTISHGSYFGEIGLDVLGSAGNSLLTKTDIIVPVHTNPNYARWDTTNTIEEKGILYVGSTFLRLKESTVNDGVFGIESNDGNLRLECSRVQSPNTAAQARYGILKNGGTIHMRNGYNLIEAHNFRIISDQALLAIDKGMNVIDRNNNPFFSSILHPKQTLAQSSNYTLGTPTNATCILATGNHWQSNNSSSLGASGFSPYPLINYNIHLVNYDNTGNPQWHDLGYDAQLNTGGNLYNDYYDANCPRTPQTFGTLNPVNILPDLLVQQYSTNNTFGGLTALAMPSNPPSTINTGHSYGTALQVTLDRYNDSPYVDYSVLLPELKYLSKAVLLDTLFELSYFTYSQTHSAYYQSLYDSTLSDSLLTIRNDSFGNGMLSYQNDLIDKHDNGDSFWKDITYELYRDKALILRSLDRRSDAMTTLSDFVAISSDTLYTKQANVWSCFIEQEQMVLDSLIPADSVNFNACLDPYNFIPDTTAGGGSSSLELTHSAKIESESMTLYPNPSDNGFYLSGTSDLDPSNLSLYDALGRKISPPTWNLNKTKLFIDASQLEVGMYTLVYAPKENHRFEFKVMVLR